MTVIMHTSSTAWKSELSKSHIETWLANFTGEAFAQKYERLLALWLLGHFTFYNQEEVTHLCKVIYRDLIHRVLSNYDGFGIGMDPSNLIESFFSKATIIASEQTSGSGGFIAYLFRHANDLPMPLFSSSIDSLSSTTENIIIIDDVTLTPGEGGQMHKFLTTNVAKYRDKKFFLLTLVSSDASADYLRRMFQIEVVTAIRLDPRDRCFSPQSDIFAAYPNLRDIAQTFAECYGRKILETGPLGYENGQCTFGFFYNTPDNTLPIFWGQTSGWEPIISRFHKNYHGRRFLGNERFV